MHLNGNAHSGKEPAVTGITAHPAAVQVKDFLDQSLHGLNRLAALFEILPAYPGFHGFDHGLAFRCLVHLAPANGHQPDIVVDLQVTEQSFAVGFGVHDQITQMAFIIFSFNGHAFGFMSRVGHPQEAAQNRNSVSDHAKTAVAVDPPVGTRFAPSGVFIKAVQPVRNDAQGFVFLMPDRTFGLGHHLVSADDCTLAPFQETVEK